MGKNIHGWKYPCAKICMGENIHGWKYPWAKISMEIRLLTHFYLHTWPCDVYLMMYRCGRYNYRSQVMICLACQHMYLADLVIFESEHILIYPMHHYHILCVYTKLCVCVLNCVCVCTKLCIINTGLSHVYPITSKLIRTCTLRPTHAHSYPQCRWVSSKFQRYIS